MATKSQTLIEKAKAEYPSASAEKKKFLEEYFGIETFKPQYVKTFSDAYPLFLKMKFKDALYKNLQKRKVADLTAFDILLIIACVLRGDWKADWGNTNQYKYYPWFEYDRAAAGFGFSYAHCGRAYSGTCVGSRLCFPTEEMAEYFGKQFIELHNQYLLINQ